MIIILSFILRTAQYVTKIVERAQRAEDARPQSPRNGDAQTQPERSLPPARRAKLPLLRDGGQSAHSRSGINRWSKLNGRTSQNTNRSQTDCQCSYEGPTKAAVDEYQVTIH